MRRFCRQRQSGSVVDRCVALERFSPCQFTVGLPASPSFRPDSFFVRRHRESFSVFTRGLVYFNRRKTFLAGISTHQSAINTPMRRNNPGRAVFNRVIKELLKNAGLVKPVSRFLEKVDASQTGELISSPTTTGTPCYIATP